MVQVYGTSNFLILLRQLNVSLMSINLQAFFLSSGTRGVRTGPCLPSTLHEVHVMDTLSQPLQRNTATRAVIADCVETFAHSRHVERRNFGSAGPPYKDTTRPSSRSSCCCRSRILEHSSHKFYWVIGKRQKQVLSLMLVV